MRLVPSAAIALAAAAVLGACSTARDVEGSSTTDDCTRCHGFPPTQVSGTGESHPSNTSCFVCHAATVDANNEIIPGGAHMNGSVDVTGGHDMPFVGQHTAAALADIASCTSCHGSDYGGGSDPGAAPSCNGCHQGFGCADWKTNCTFCHGGGAGRDPTWSGNAAEAAPPQTVAGSSVEADQSNTNPKVGAHQRHLVAGTYSAPLACGSCHAVPAQTFPGSLDHVNGSAEIHFSDVARQGVTNPGYAGAGGSCAVYCHGSASLDTDGDGIPDLSGGANKTPAWTSSGGVVCGACHDVAQDSAQASGLHQFHVSDKNVSCDKCHPGYAVGSSPTVNLDTHMNGTFEATPVNAGGTTYSSWPSGCACHN